MSSNTVENARKGKDSDRENKGKDKPKQNGESHRVSHQGRNSGNNRK